MTTKPKTREQLLVENEVLRTEADEAKAMVAALGEQLEALRLSETRYRSVFTAMTEGFALHEIMTDEAGQPCDYRFLEVNPAFERLTGLAKDDLIGRCVRDVLPGIESVWIERYGRVALTGDPAHFEHFSGDLQRWYEVLVYRTAVRQFAVFFTDVTERKQVEAELRRSEQDLDRAQAVGQIGSWRLDIRSNHLTWSAENFRIFGVTPGTPLTYETFLSIVHPDDRRYVNERWKAALRDEPYDIEHRIVVDGRVKWVRERAYPEFDDAGELSGGFGITQDITTHKLVEAEVASLARFPQENPSPVLRISAEGLVLKANPAVEPMLADHASGVGLPAPVEWMRWVRDALSKRRRQTANTKHRDRTFSFDVVPIAEQGYANLYGRDISVQERTLEALRVAHAELEERVAERTRDLSASTELLERMFEDSHLLMAHLDKDFNYLRVNRSYAQAGGYDSADLPGKNLFAIFPNRQHEEVFRRVVTTGQRHSVHADPFMFARRSESATPCWDWSLQPVRGTEGDVTGVVLSLLDVTARVRLEQAIVRIEERERRATSAELHDTVGQQLTAIGYMADNLEQELIARGVPMSDRLRDLRKAVTTADAQVRSLSRGLYPAQLASGGLPGALEDLARHVVDRFGIACSCDCPGSVALDEVAATQVLRIAQEAVTNAVKHAKPSRIDICLRPEVDWLVLTVRDDGVGMPEDLSNSAGLGLRIMSHRAGTAGGTVSVARGDEGGTTVQCSVPTKRR